MARPPLPATGAINWQDVMNSAIYDVSDRADAALAQTSTGMPGVAALDSFAGSSDDAKLAAAISFAGSQTYPPSIRLGSRLYTFNQPLGRVYDGFSIEGPVDSWKSSAAAKTAGCEVHLALTPRSGEPAGYWLEATTGSIWNWSVRNIYFSGTGSTQFCQAKGSANGGGLMQGCSFHSLQFNGFRSVFGNAATKCSLQISVIDGYWSIQGSTDTPVHLGGSDNRGLFADGLNIDSGAAANGRYHIILDYLDKSNIGPVYVNCDTVGWRGIKILGGAGNGGGLIIRGAIIEGRNATNAALGELVTVQGGWPVLDGCTIDCGMTSPSAGEVGMVSCTGSNSGVTVRDCTFELASGQNPATVPCIHISNGATAYIAGAIPWQRDTGSPSWGSNLPRLEVASGAGTVISDATVNRVAV